MKIGFLGLLGIVFIVLKLTGVIAWNWLVVLSPLILDSILIVIVICVIAELKVKNRRKLRWV